MILGITGIIGSGKDTVAKMVQYHYADKEKFNSAIMQKFCTDEKYYSSIMRSLIGNNINFEIRKFAYKLKEISSKILNCTIDDLENRDFKEQIMPDILQLKAQNMMFEDEGYKDKTYRWFLQHFSDHLKILLGKDYFVNELFSHYKAIFDYCENDIEKTYNNCVGCDGNGIGDCNAIMKYPNWIISDLRFINEAKAIHNRGGKIIKLVGRGDKTHNHISELELNGIEADVTILNSGSIEDLYENVCIALQTLGLK